MNLNEINILQIVGCLSNEVIIRQHMHLLGKLLLPAVVKRSPSAPMHFKAK